MSDVLITSSTELMSNYKQAQVLAPERKFEALQTNAGDALLFSIGTDDAFYATVEKPGLKTGWDRHRLSAEIPGAKAKSFAVGQDPTTGEINLALVMTAAGIDTLYVSMHNSADDISWISTPGWTALPFDDATHKLPKTVIANVFVSDAADGEFVAADILRNPSDKAPLVLRYFLDPSKALTGAHWNPHDVAGDVDAATVASCLGRRKGDRIDGLYTGGAVAGQGQLFFQPLYNVFNPRVAPNPARLTLPEGAVPRAIAAASSTGEGTDLYVAFGQKVHFYPADGQQDGGTGVTIIDNPLFADVQRLFAYASPSKVVVWGLNRANQIFYTSCDPARVVDASAWSTPLPICEEVEHVAPYVNRANDGNAFFVHTGQNLLERAVQAADTTTWKFDRILLAALPEAKAQKFDSYTTRLQVTDAQKQPLPNVAIALSAPHRAGVFINGLYYVLDTSPIQVRTDAIGSITIVEWVTNLTGTPIKAAHRDGPQLAINPMDKPFAKAAALTSADALTGAQITAEDGSKRPLVPADADPAEVKAAAHAFEQLGTIYRGLPKDGSPARTAAAAMRSRGPLQVTQIRTVAAAGAATVHAQAMLGDPVEWIETAAGDLVNWLEGASDYVVHIVELGGSGLWHFVAQIAGEAYTFVLDAADKVVGGLVAIYNMIKTKIEDLIDYLKFLFEWDSFVRSKDVFKNLLLISLDVVLARLETIKQDVNGFLDAARTNVDNWAGVKADGWKAIVPNGSQPLGFMRSVADLGSVLTAPGMSLYQHFFDNLSGAQSANPDSGSGDSSVLTRVLTVMENEGGIIVNALDRIKSELVDGDSFSTMPLEEVLKKLTAIVVDAFLDSAENLIDALLDFLVLVARAGVEDLDTAIRIPVVSDILEEFGVSIDFSVLDLLLMVAAIPATIGYKIAHGSAPFSSGDGFSDKILAANSPAELVAAFATPATPAPAEALPRAAIAFSDRSLPANSPELVAAFDAAPASAARAEAPPIAAAAEDAPGDGALGAWIFTVNIGHDAARSLYTMGHVFAGMGALFSAALVPGADQAQANDTTERAQTGADILSGMGAVLTALVVTPTPIQNTDMAAMAKVLTFLKVANKLPNSAVGKKVFGRTPTTQQKKVERALDATIAFLALTPTCYHFQELAQAPAGEPRSAAIVEETGNIADYFSRIAAFFVAIDEEPESKAALEVTQALLLVVNSGLHFAEAGISPS